MANPSSTAMPEERHGELRVGDAIVRKSRGHPSGYLFITPAEGGEYFLGVLTPGMTRGEVKKMARDWLERRKAQSLARRSEGE